MGIVGAGTIVLMGTIAPAHLLSKRIYEVDWLRFVIFLKYRQVLVKL